MAERPGPRAVSWLPLRDHCGWPEKTSGSEDRLLHAKRKLLTGEGLVEQAEILLAGKEHVAGVTDPIEVVVVHRRGRTARDLFQDFYGALESDPTEERIAQGSVGRRADRVPFDRADAKSVSSGNDAAARRHRAVFVERDLAEDRGTGATIDSVMATATFTLLGCRLDSRPPSAVDDRLDEHHPSLG